MKPLRKKGADDAINRFLFYKKNTKQVKSLDEIRESIKDAENDLSIIKNMDGLDFYVCSKQDSLVEKLGNTCASIKEFLLEFPSMKKTCISLLGKLLDVSENLKGTYIVPAYYTQSFDIFDTIRGMEKE